MNDTENTASVVKEASLLIRCLAVDVLLLRAFAYAGIPGSSDQHGFAYQGPTVYGWYVIATVKLCSHTDCSCQIPPLFEE
jgi:hypothetical protein